MPAIRDFSIGFSGATATTNITVPLPAYTSGDLLIAFINHDTGTKTTTRMNGSITGGTWTALLDDVNTNQGQIMYCSNYTGSATETTFTRADASSETFDVIIVSVYDYNTTTPFNATPAAFTTQAAAAKITFPSITTTINNCLLFHYWALSSNPSTTAGNSPVINEGPVTFLTGIEGGSTSANPGGEVSALGWGFKAAAGATPSNVGGSCITTGAGLKITIAVAPPAGGATVIPTYCVSDSSAYLTPISGTNAYNGDTAFAATATTYFPTPLAAPNSRPVSNGTVANLADQGLSSWYTVGQLTGVTTNGTWAGATNVFATANKPNVANKNVLIHAAPATPKSLQTTDSITKGTTKGIAIGLFASASNYKVWHVHGVGTSWNDSRHVPLIINTGNTSGLISSTGTMDGTSVLGIGMFVSGFVAAPVWAFYSAWSLDTTTVVGGNAANPINVTGITRAVADGHLRKSILQQGSGQATILQPIQIGDGTNATYLDLDSTAIEFPQQYNLTSKQVFYCSTNNVAGITYYAANGDTIKHSNAIVSSKSKYHWKIHPSSSATATYNFDGLVVIGAGTVQLANNVNISGITFNACDEITAATSTITSCIFTNSTGTNGAVSITGTDQTTLQAALNKIVSSSFNNNTTPLGALRIIRSSGSGNISLDMTGITFSGNTADIRWECAAGSNLTINKLGTTNASTYTATNSNTVSFQVSATLQITGLIAGSDIVILNAGTTTERVNVDANAGTTYNYGYTTTGDVDICIYKQGYIPYTVRTYSLSAGGGTLPVKQVLDRAFSNPA